MGMQMEYEIRNIGHTVTPLRIGNGTPKLIVNLGLTNSYHPLGEELAKANLVQKYGGHMIADVSTLGDIRAFQRLLIAEIGLPLNSVPLYEIYQAAREVNDRNLAFPKSLVLEVIEAQAETGVDCMTLHCGYTIEQYSGVIASDRRIRVQARGGGIIHEYFRATRRQNPLYEYLDVILPILRRYNVTLSIGNCLRTGTVDDPFDSLANQELNVVADIVKMAQGASVNVMVEGFSHIRFAMIAPYVRMVKGLCRGAPIRLLGPLGTEKGLGYDHVTAAICVPPAVTAGVDLLTLVTRAEHIGLPSLDDVREAVVAYRIALELATQPYESENNTSTFLCGLGFDHLSSDDVFDLERAVELKADKNHGDISACSMCSELCRIQVKPSKVHQARRVSKSVRSV